MNTKIRPIRNVVTWSIRLPKFFIPFSKSVAESFSPKDAVIFPNSESLAKFTMTALPEPLITWVPIQREFFLFDSTVSADTF